MALGVEEAVWAFLRLSSPPVTGEFLPDIVNLIILPSIILIIFLDFATSLFLGGHKNLKTLLTIALFMVIIIQGFYAMFATFASNFIMLFLMFAIVLFALTRFLRPEQSERIGTAFGGLGNEWEKQKARKKLRENIRKIEDMVDERKTILRRGNVPDHQASELQRQIGELETKKMRFEDQLRSL